MSFFHSFCRQKIAFKIAIKGKKQNIEMADGALALDAPSSTESICAYEEWNSEVCD